MRQPLKRRQKLLDSIVTSTSNGLNDRQVIVDASTQTKDRAGDVLIAAGCVHGETVPVLANHEATLQSVVGDAKVWTLPDRVRALITFLPQGISELADLACQLYKNGYRGSVSVGFNPIKATPIKGGGYTYEKWELLELSCVVIPCNPEAQVVQRQMHGRSGRVLNSENHAKLTQAHALIGDVLDVANGTKRIITAGQKRARVARAKLAQMKQADMEREAREPVSDIEHRRCQAIAARLRKAP